MSANRRTHMHSAHIHTPTLHTYVLCTYTVHTNSTCPPTGTHTHIVHTHTLPHCTHMRCAPTLCTQTAHIHQHTHTHSHATHVSAVHLHCAHKQHVSTNRHTHMHSTHTHIAHIHTHSMHTHTHSHATHVSAVHLHRAHKEHVSTNRHTHTHSIHMGNKMNTLKCSFLNTSEAHMHSSLLLSFDVFQNKKVYEVVNGEWLLDHGTFWSYSTNTTRSERWMKIFRVSLNRRMDKQNVVHPHKECCPAWKEGSSDTGYRVDGLWRHYAQRHKADMEEQMLFVYTHTRHLEQSAP